MNKSFEKIALSPLNRSPSKALYSFSKGKRFQKDFKPICQKFYQTRNSFSKRSTSFGFGTKVSMGGQNFIPPPGKYQSKGQFDINKMKNKGYSFGSDHNRQLINQKISKQIPGPGSYLAKQSKFSNLSYTIGAKIDQSKIRHPSQLGPGQYELIGLNSTGTYYNTKFKNSGCGIIGKQKRFNYFSNQIPGPGTYRGQQHINLNKDGVYFNSKYKSNAVRTFSRSSRPSPALKTLSPGPGQYPQFSQFGLKVKGSNKRL